MNGFKLCKSSMGQPILSTSAKKQMILCTSDIELFLDRFIFLFWQAVLGLEVNPVKINLTLTSSLEDQTAVDIFGL